ncbi:MAG TPA: glycoside hydrolase family 44 protein [Candidatus Dormibacteraeota bacterium]
MNRTRALGALLVAVVAVSGLAVAASHPGLLKRIRAHLAAAGQPTAAPASVSFGDLTDVVVTVDGGAPGTPISPLIYGVAGASAAELEALGAASNRWGGNPASTYNWVNGHAWNAARDWEFRNANYGPPSGSAADAFVTSTLGAAATPVLTIPTIGYVARNDDNDTRSLGVPAQGGPALAPGSQAIKGYDPSGNQLRIAVPSLPRKPGPFVDEPPANSSPVYQDEWVHHLVSRYGPNAVRFFEMDNEPDLWPYTHTDIHPVEPTYADLLANFETYAAAVKVADPSAQVMGPVLSGWTGYMYSPADAGTDTYATHADRTAHGGEAFLPWWLAQVAAHDRATGVRSLDYLDVHYYPQGQGVYSPAADQATRELRIRSTRSLWDPTYKDESWIDDSVDLIPRLKGWINANYPGTKLAISEYHWGGEKDASGAVAEAIVLGTFGRYGVDMASFWTVPPVMSPTGAAFRLYRNYDGRGAAFGDLSLPVRVNQAGVSAFAARHSQGGEADVVIVNQSVDQSASVRVALAGSTAGHADEYSVTGGSAEIVHTSISLASAVQLAPMSIALLRVAA